MKKAVRFLVLGSLLAALVVAGALYFHHEALYPNTDDAYIQANVVNIAPRITGKVATVDVRNLQYVHQGQTLLTIDPTPFKLAVEKAKATLANTEQNVKAAASEVHAAKAMVVQRDAQLINTAAQSKRILILAKHKLASPAQEDQARSNFRVAVAALNAAKSQLNEAEQKLGAAGANNASIREAKATLAQAQLNLSYTTVRAPTSGFLQNVTMQPGDQITADTNQFVLIESGHWWTDANFKETDLSRIHPGQRATIKTDTYPNHLFHGKVVSISPASGVSFSLLPPENATGNWVKVTQRFPIRIAITNPSKQFPLRLGASATVTIDTRS